MKKSPVWIKFAVAGAVVAVVMVTSAARFLSPSVNTRNGIVYGYAPGKSITIKGFDRQPFEYIVNSSTQILPDSLARGLAGGAQVTVVYQCFTTAATSGCLALDVWVRTPASSGSSASAPAPAAASPVAPVATPTP